MIKKLLILVVGVLICTSYQGYSQDVDVKNVDVNALSDDQIMQIISEMESRGLSENEAINMARLKGMSNSQISLLQKRIQEVKLSGGLDNYQQENSSTGENATNVTELSKKALVDENMVEEKIFGFSFFNNTNLSFEPSVNIPVPDSYVLGTGDEVIIDIWGASQQSYQLEVNTNGQINIPLVGPIYVSGHTMQYAKGVITEKLSSIYSDLRSSTPRTFASIRTGQLKSIKVNVLGEVFAPGTYTLPGTSTLFNVLYLSGGPNKQGSFRDIRLIRNGKVISNLDVYDYLINGNSTINVPLMDNDVVMIPTYKKRVRVDGEFKRNGIFEAKDAETVQDLIIYAGGFTEEAYKSKLKLYRNTGKERAIKEVSVNNASDIELYNGDRLSVGKILNRYENIVSISGAVFSPGDFEYTEGLTLKGLVDKADGVIENAFLNRGLITRLKEDYTPENISFDVGKILSGNESIDLKRNDKVFIASIDNTRESRTVAIWGEVKDMGEFPYADNLTIEDLVLMAGGFKESASESTIEVRRRLSYDEADKNSTQSSELFYFRVSRDLKLDEQASQFVLKPYDAIAVRYMPGWESNGSVTVNGQIMYGGIYNLTSAKERVSDVIKRAGGLRENAYPIGATLIRKVYISDEEQAKRDELMEKDSTLTFSELDFENVSVNLERIIKNPGSKEDIYMRNGDVLRIPTSLQTVKISGEILNPSSTVYEKSFSVKKYINMSGGFSLNAKKGKTYVLMANGASHATKGFLFFRRYPKVTPGAEIVIPKRPERQGMTPQAWIGIGSALASMSLTFITIADRL
ncbi:SLBB domain-containing protein [Plebeiibacterium marinum]|uniref:SLBB domain-containing protein n=1 Tax=Plebeiibacterium marinum TaxID=2992111 RepID=A0AAE3MDW7_9BACT|nr:SLBB domain-containing protein [Plebeiobacterium marinum]MCW3805797.1 SLBB domain-containing protein [Plebeiobacterium marinum]